MPNGYRKPLVAEAIIDFRVVPLSEMTLEMLAEVAQSLQNQFPRREAMITGTFEFGFYEGKAAAPQADQKHNGFRLTSGDGLKVLQISEEGFTFSRLSPYPGWQAFLGETKELWQQYQTLYNLQEVRRVGLRYINRVDFPATERIRDFLALRPNLPEQLPSREMLGFFMQLQLPQQDLESVLIVNQARVEPPDENTISVVLDLDLYREQSWAAEQEAAIWELLERFRLRKNEVFEASITEKTRRLME